MKRTPKLCRHKARNLGYSTDPRTGHVVYHGPWGLRSTKENYSRWVAAFASGLDPLTPSADPIVADLINQFARWAETYYRDPVTGKPTSQIHVLKSALRELKNYLTKPIKDFTPQDLIAVRAEMMERPVTAQSKRTKPKPLTISTVNSSISKIKMAFKRGVEWGLVPVAVYHALSCVQSLSWRTAPTLRTTEPIKPVDQKDIDAIIPHLKPMHRVMVKLHCATGMRITELVSMRWSEIEQVDYDLWCYRPGRHKNSHRQQDRVIYFHKDFIQMMRSIRKPLWDPDLVWCSKGKGRHRGYTGQATVSSYQRAIQWAQTKYNRTAKRKLRWTPLQIRHMVGTRVREMHGLEGSQAVLGHSRIDSTQIYAERRDDLARKLARGDIK
jgi:integrase